MATTSSVPPGLLTLLRSAVPAWAPYQVPRWPYVAPTAGRPTAAELAKRILDSGELAALNIAIWSQTDRGRLVEAIISDVSPQVVVQDEKLLFDALDLAVEEYAAGRRRAAGLTALAGLATAGLLFGASR